MSNCDHVVGADVWCDQNIAGEVEVDQKRDEFIKRHQVVRSHEWYMEHQYESVVLWPVDLRSFHQKKVRRLMDK